MAQRTLPITLPDGRALPLPAVCAPLVGRTTERLLQETRTVAARQPDLLEWRIDFFDAIADTDAVLAAAREIRREAGELPILFTRRSIREGGERIPLDEAGVLALYRAVCASGCVQWMDYEISNDEAQVQEVRAMTRHAGLGLVLSFHDFARTPPAAELVQRFTRAHALGADVAKVAVMPRTRADVLQLLAATDEASQALPIPVVSMAMGGLGAITRMGGAVFGSALTFAVGENPSAPGQMPIADVKAAIDMLRRAMPA